MLADWGDYVFEPCAFCVGTGLALEFQPIQFEILEQEFNAVQESINESVRLLKSLVLDSSDDASDRDDDDDERPDKNSASGDGSSR